MGRAFDGDGTAPQLGMNAPKPLSGSKCHVRRSDVLIYVCSGVTCGAGLLNFVFFVQSLVEDPAACVRETKLRLAEKEGIPVEQQRLIFYTQDAEEAVSTGTLGSESPGSAEELLLTSGRWEVG